MGVKLLRVLRPPVSFGLQDRQAGMIGFITLQQSAPSQMTWQDRQGFFQETHFFTGCVEWLVLSAWWFSSDNFFFLLFLLRDFILPNHSVWWSLIILDGFCIFIQESVHAVVILKVVDLKGDPLLDGFSIFV
jgi:hypothetical protein